MKAPRLLPAVLLVLALNLGAGAPALLARGGGHGGGGRSGGGRSGGGTSAGVGNAGGVGNSGGAPGRAGNHGGQGGYGRGRGYGFTSRYGVPGTFTGYGDPYGLHRDAVPRSFLGGPAVVGQVSAVDVQRALRARGYYRGRVNGRFGADSGQALERFRQDRGLATGGYLDPATVGALGLGPR